MFQKTKKNDLIFCLNKQITNNENFRFFRSQLAKAKIDGPTTTEAEKKDDSGNETGAGEGEPEEDTEVIHYDKAKSFFDNISCEAVERIKGWLFHAELYYFQVPLNN